MSRVSVIMGVYNCEKTVAASIDSILSQTFTDWEFIICDDGSTDGSYSILQGYEKRFPSKIKVYKNDKNMGLTKTLNICLSYCDSEYIARMDADDVSLPERFQKQVDFLDGNKEYGFVGCLTAKFDENGVWATTSSIEKPTSSDFLWGSCFAHPTVLLRKSALDSVGCYRESSNTNRCEDYDLWLRMYAAGIIGYNLQEILFYYYEGKNSYPKRKYRYRINEAKVRLHGFKALGLMPKGHIYVVKPLVVGLLPHRVVRKLRGKSNNKK